MYTLDTNAILYYVGGEKSVQTIIDDLISNGVPLYVSAVSVCELFIFPKLTETEEKNILKFLSICSVITLDADIASRAGSIGRRYAIKLPDSIIAATALFTGSTLLTRNTRDFRRVPLLSLQTI